MNMTESKDQDKALHDYLTGNTALSGQYRRLHSDEPQQETDRAILAAAQQEVSRHAHARWYIPAAVAAMLVIGASIIFWQQPSTPPAQHNAAAPAPDTQLPQQVDRMLHDNPSADRWLERILKLHQSGKTAEAAREFQKFRQAYPAYSLDPERFGALSQYDNQE
jgi:hypothetical protein